MHPGCDDAAARLEDMELNGVEGSMICLTFPWFCGQTFHQRHDRELGRTSAKANNDWLVEEWCGG